MSRLLRPGWIVSHLAVAAVAVLFVNLGLWQLERHAQVQADNARLAQVVDGPPLPLEEALAAEQPDYLPTGATGTFEPDGELRLGPRSRNDLPGYHVLTPLRLSDGRALLVDRGWVPLDRPAPPPPTGQVRLAGRLQPSMSARQVLPPGAPDDGRPAELVSGADLPLLAGQVPGLIRAAYLEVVDEEARQAGTLPRPAEPVALESGNHLSYAVQWFIFTVIGLVGYPLLLRRRLADHAADADGRAPREVDRDGGGQGPAEGAGHPAGVAK